MHPAPYFMSFPHPAAAAAAAAAAAPAGPIDTIMISNISPAATEFDLVSLVGSLAGYKRSKLMGGARGSTAWVQFVDIASADAAIRSLSSSSSSSSIAADAQGIRVAYSKRPMGVPGRASAAALLEPAGGAKRARDASFVDPMKRSADFSMMQQQQHHHQQQQLAFPYAPTAAYPGFVPGGLNAGVFHAYPGAFGAAIAPPAPFYSGCYLPPRPMHGIDASSRGIPIDTIMVSNISLGTSEQDLVTVMNGFAGYKRSKLTSNGATCSAWVQFDDVKAAEAVINALNGSSSIAADSQGLRVAYSKRPMGVPGRASAAGAAYSAAFYGQQPHAATFR